MPDPASPKVLRELLQRHQFRIKKKFGQNFLIDGNIININVRPTENVVPGTPLFTVSNQNGLVTRFYVGINEIDYIKTGARVYIVNSEAVAGQVSQVSLLMDSKSRAFPVTAYFDITNAMASMQARPFISGISLDIAVETYRNENAIVVSRKELLRTDTGYAAFIADGNRAKRVDVQVGQEKAFQVEITGGLEEGNMLITDGITELADNSLINIVGTTQAAQK